MTTQETTRSGPEPVAVHTGLQSALLTCGVVAGPMFVAVAVAQMLTRDGFDLRRHAISMLSLGDLGWIQITSFVVTGFLAIACAVGMRRALHSGLAGTWEPRLVGAYGLGLIAAGIFPPDAGVGFPPGAPAGVPAMSWHSMLHAVSGTGAFVALTAAAFVLTHRHARCGARARAVYCAATGFAMIPLVGWPGTAGAGIRLAVAAVLAWGLIAVTAHWLRTHPSN